jgi:hypothetical protein
MKTTGTPCHSNEEKDPIVEPPCLELRLGVLVDDGWRCCYCGQHLVHPRVLELFGRLFPDPVMQFPTGRNPHSVPEGKTNAAILEVYPAVDHRQPRSRRGTNDRGNLYAACQDCNEAKGGCYPEEADMPEPVRAPDGWSGLLTALRRLEDVYHRREPPTRRQTDTQRRWRAHADLAMLDQIDAV